jgi:large subunit ribosomal protein L29
MKPHEIREKTNAELKGSLATIGEELFNARFQHYNGSLENTQKIPHLRRDLARIKSELRRRELGIAKAPEEAAQIASKA